MYVPILDFVDQYLEEQRYYKTNGVRKCLKSLLMGNMKSFNKSKDGSIITALIETEIISVGIF